MTVNNETRTYDALSHLMLRQAEMLTPAGTNALHLLTDIQLRHPHFSESQHVKTFYNSDQAQPVWLSQMSDIFSSTPEDRALELTMQWVAQSERLSNTKPDHIILCSPLHCDVAVSQCLPWQETSFEQAIELEECVTKMNEWVVSTLQNTPADNPEATQLEPTLLVLTLDSLIDENAFSKQHSPLFHEQNQEGIIASEGLTALWFTASSLASKPIYITEELLAQEAETQNTQALKTLIAHAPVPSEQILSNHDHTTNQAMEAYRFSHLQNHPQPDPNEEFFNEHAPHFSLPQPIDPPDTDPSFTSIRQSFVNTGLNDFGVLLALYACSQQFDLQHTYRSILMWSEENRLYWPELNYTPFAKGNCNE